VDSQSVENAIPNQSVTAVSRTVSTLEEDGSIIRVRMDIALRKRALSPVRLVLEDSSKRSIMMLFVVISL